MDTLPQNNQSFMDLPPVENQNGVISSGKVEAPKQQGTERNPELLPPQSTQVTPLTQPVSTPADPGALATPIDPSLAGGVPLTSSAQAPIMPQMADDIDLIEKEWVEKAKDIVNKTKDDPRIQNKELNKVKAEYIKQRFQRDIPVSQESDS